MTPQLTPELRDALLASAGQPVRIDDEATHQTYFLVSQDQVRALMNAELRRELQMGYDDVARGDIVPFDANDIKKRGMERLRQARS